MTKARINFVKMGVMERCKFGRDGRLRARFVEAWSENGTTQPWKTRREACYEARLQGAQARFIDPAKLPVYPLIGGGTTTDRLEHLKNQRTFACNFEEIKMLDKLILQEEKRKGK